MANPSSSSICILLLTVLLSGAGMSMVHGKSCSEGYVWVTTSCDKKGNAGPECWEECKRRHGENVKADCRSGPGYPGSTFAYCECWYPC